MPKNSQFGLAEAILKIADFLPLGVFSGLRWLGMILNDRLLVGGGLAALALSRHFFGRGGANPVVLGINVFFFVTSLVVLGGASPLGTLFTELRETGMIGFIVLAQGLAYWVLAARHVLALNRRITCLMASFGLLFASYRFRGNEDLAGGIPVSCLLLLHYWVLRGTAETVPSLSGVK